MNNYVLLCLSIVPMDNLTITISHTDDTQSGAFFVPGEEDQRLAEMTYLYTANNAIVIDHTEVKEALRGQGVGHTLLKEAVRYVRNNDLKLMATCPWAKEELIKHEQYKDVFVAGN